jgi:hypothetical protein
MKTDVNVNLDAVKEFGLDVWDDLGRTRLAGVAIGLALVLLVITALVVRPNGGPEVQASDEFAASASSFETAEDEVTFTMPGEKPLKLSDIELSAPRDPFESAGGSSTGSDQTLLPADDEIQTAALGSDGGDSGSVSTASGYDDSTALMPIDDLGGTSTPSEAAPAEPREPRQPASVETPDDEPETTSPPATDYSYAADIQFGLVNDLKRYAHVQRLGLVPSRQLPLLMYLGVTADHSTAVFMVDSRLSQGGEGRCVPKASLCTFLEMRPSADRDEHHFRDADGNEYLLRLRRLVRTDAESGTLNGRSVSELGGSPAVVDGTR